MNQFDFLFTEPWKTGYVQGVTWFPLSNVEDQTVLFIHILEHFTFVFVFLRSRKFTKK